MFDILKKMKSITMVSIATSAQKVSTYRVEVRVRETERLVRSGKS